MASALVTVTENTEELRTEDLALSADLLEVIPTSEVQGDERVSLRFYFILIMLPVIHATHLILTYVHTYLSNISNIIHTYIYIVKNQDIITKCFYIKKVY